MTQNVTGNEGLSYTIVRSRRRTMSVEIQPHGNVVVRAPSRLPLYEIERFVELKSAWIMRRVRDAEARKALVPILDGPRSFYHRGSVRTWGFTGDGADLIVPSRLRTENAAMRYVERWQRSEADQLFAEMVADALPKIGVPGLRYQGLRVRTMRRRWGSCSSTGHVTLNGHLIRVPDGCIRGVVVHEVCHLAHLHHGPAFHQLVADVYPEHALADAILDAWTHVLYQEPFTP